MPPRKPISEYDDEWFDIIDGFVTDDHTVLLLKHAAPTEESAVAVEELFEAFSDPIICVLPEKANVSRVTRERLAARVGVNLAALNDAKKAYAELSSQPSEGAFRRIGEALDKVWTYRDPR